MPYWYRRKVDPCDQQYVFPLVRSFLREIAPKTNTFLPEHVELIFTDQHLTMLKGVSLGIILGWMRRALELPQGEIPMPGEFQVLRELFRAQEGLTAEQATAAYPDDRLICVRTADPATYNRWVVEAYQAKNAKE